VSLFLNSLPICQLSKRFQKFRPALLENNETLYIIAECLWFEFLRKKRWIHDWINQIFDMQNESISKSRLIWNSEICQGIVQTFNILSMKAVTLYWFPACWWLKNDLQIANHAKMNIQELSHNFNLRHQIFKKSFCDIIFCQQVRGLWLCCGVLNKTKWFSPWYHFYINHLTDTRPISLQKYIFRQEFCILILEHILVVCWKFIISDWSCVGPGTHSPQKW